MREVCTCRVEGLHCHHSEASSSSAVEGPPGRVHAEGPPGRVRAAAGSLPPCCQDASVAARGVLSGSMSNAKLMARIMKYAKLWLMARRSSTLELGQVRCCRRPTTAAAKNFVNSTSAESLRTPPNQAHAAAKPPALRRRRQS
jgi:hypothetical protein